ncbi:MAG: NfeD family protein [Gemmatimonadales bacterium]
MKTFYLVCAAVGGVVLVLQVALSMLGVGIEHELEAELEEGLDLLSVRALAAGLAFFGLGGLVGSAFGLGALVGLPLGGVAGIAATVVTARVTRAILRLESDRTPRIEESIGERGTVYLAIPAAGDGHGKVHVALRGRLVELAAVSRTGAIPTGTAIEVVDTEGETLIVAPLTTE